MKSSNKTKQKNETRFLSGEWKRSFSIMLLALLLSFTQNVKAQAPDWEWAKGIGGPGSERGHSVAVDTYGNSLIAGTFSGTVDFDPGAGVFNLTSAGGVDIFILKLDNSGNFIWAKKIGGSGNDGMFELSRHIATDVLGNVYVTGQFEGTADLNPGSAVYNVTSAGGTDIFICKLDNSGNFIWAKAIGGNSADESHSIAIDANGFVYTAGAFSSQVDFDPDAGIYNLNSAGSKDIFILKLNDTGNFVWARKIGGGQGDESYGMSLDQGGNVYTTGYFEGTTDFDPGTGVFNLTSAGYRDIFISKLNTSGGFEWAKKIGGGGDQFSRGLIADDEGNTYVDCTFQGTVDFDPGAGTFYLTGGGGWNMAITKLDNMGNFIWAKQFYQTTSCGIHSFAVDAYDNLYSAGIIYGTTDFDPGIGIFNLTPKSADPFICKLDSSGNFMWAKIAGNTGFEFIVSIALDPIGNLIATGYFNSATIPFDSTTITNHGSVDIFIAKIPAPKPLFPRNCSEILKQNPAAPSGVYTIDPDGTGPLPSMSCNCDMTTDGGGWMLVLNYNRLSGTDPALNIFTNSLPLQNNTAPGFDESNTPYWGHAGNALMSAIPFDEIRFYGVTTNHNRVMNFKSNDLGTVYYFKTGIGNAYGLKSNFMHLNGHNANLPASIDYYFDNEGDYAMTQAPFYTSATYHWLIKTNNGDCGGGNRWEADDYCTSLAPSTFHQIWVRQSGMDSCSTITCSIDPKIHNANVANVTNASCNDGKIKVNLDGTFQFFPYLELFNNSSGLAQSISLPFGTSFYRFKNLEPGNYTVKVYDDKCCETVLVANVKCAPPATGISTTNVTATSVQFNWDVVNCAMGYRIHYREQGSSAWWTTTGVNTNVGSKTVFGLSPATTYEWQVATKCVGFPAFDKMEDSPLQYFSTPALRIGETVTAAAAFEINLYPNPATHTITVNFENNTATAKLQVLNTVGQVVIEKQLQSANGSYEEQLDVSKLNNGIYFLLIETASETGYTRFIKN